MEEGPKDRNKEKKSEDDDQFEDDEDDEEPKLKYERVGNAIQSILQQDAASCMAVHLKFLALGTHWGVVHVLDHQGNNIRNKEFPSHTTTVNQISIDSYGEYVASCSEDGRVVINGLYCSENNIQLMFDCPIRAIALHPEYAKRGNRQYLVGVGEKLLLYEKGWLRNKNTVLHSGTGYIRTMKWKGDFIAWADSQGVEVYDMNRRIRFAHIDKVSQNPRDDLYRCNLCWKDSNTLLIAWADYIQVGVVKERDNKDQQIAWSVGNNLPPLCVELTNVFHTDFFACGIAPFGSELVVLSYLPSSKADGKGSANRPQLLILSPQAYYTYFESSSDALSIRGFEEYQSNNYFLENVQEESLFYIVSPKDIVLAKPRDMDDHISWLMERDMFEEALADALKHESMLKTHNVLKIWKKYMNSLINSKKFKEAAKLCSKILGDDQALWEEEVYRFAKYRQLKVITPLVPFKKPRLSHTIYEMILNEYLQTDISGFQKLIKEWPSDLYESATITRVIQEKLKEEQDESNNKILLQTLATLFAHEKKYAQGLAIYLKLRDPGVFDMIEKHNLVEFLKDKIVSLMEIDEKKAVKLLTDNIETMNVEHVVRQLLNHKKLLHSYLIALFLKDAQAGQDFHELQVELLAEFDRSKLLPFLRSSNYYALEKAFKVCEERDYIPEMVFLLSRMGNSKKALSMIIEKEQDIEKAIEFTKEQKDDVLWQDLINYSIDKPLFVRELLMNIGTAIDPIILIGRIPPGMKIPGLRDALVKILQDYNLQVALHEGCKSILDKDSVAIMQRLVRVQAHGYSVSEDAKCEGCQGYVVVENSQGTADIVVFFCKHFYHERCLQQNGEEPFCPICTANVKKRKGTRSTR
ncbi:vacuolar protein sorting-associated protein 41 homolog [Rhopilema esculentum]|uniref:vacuolar protein sorting-associated protein 41 homolog n=1 Tax=Rhopilema esculentum TaxID=499914 RepID=UPI0031DC109E|eukprot:gene16896-8379_t